MVVLQRRMFPFIECLPSKFSEYLAKQTLQLHVFALLLADLVAHVIQVLIHPCQVQLVQNGS